MDEIFKLNLPASLKESAVALECFGGEMDINRLHGMDKFIAKMVTKSTAGQDIAAPSIKTDSIEALAKIIKQ